MDPKELLERLKGKMDELVEDGPIPEGKGKALRVGPPDDPAVLLTLSHTGERVLLPRRTVRIISSEMTPTKRSGRCQVHYVGVESGHCFAILEPFQAVIEAFGWGAPKGEPVGE